MHYFEPLVSSRLAYGFSTQWLVLPQRRRLDGFVARCLRRILGVPPAFISRISNATVFARAGMLSFSSQLLKQQLCFFGKVALSAAGNPLRSNTFVDNTLNPQIGRFVLKVGRPRQNWTSQLTAEGISRFGLPDLIHYCKTPAQVRKLEVSKSFAAGL